MKRFPAIALACLCLSAVLVASIVTASASAAAPDWNGRYGVNVNGFITFTAAGVPAHTVSVHQMGYLTVTNNSVWGHSIAKFSGTMADCRFVIVSGGITVSVSYTFSASVAGSGEPTVAGSTHISGNVKGVAVHGSVGYLGTRGRTMLHPTPLKAIP